MTPIMAVLGLWSRPALEEALPWREGAAAGGGGGGGTCMVMERQGGGLVSIPLPASPACVDAVFCRPGVLSFSQAPGRLPSCCCHPQCSPLSPPLG